MVQRIFHPCSLSRISCCVQSQCKSRQAETDQLHGEEEKVEGGLHMVLRKKCSPRKHSGRDAGDWAGRLTWFYVIYVISLKNTDLHVLQGFETLLSPSLF